MNELIALDAQKKDLDFDCLIGEFMEEMDEMLDGDFSEAWAKVFPGIFGSEQDRNRMPSK